MVAKHFLKNSSKTFLIIPSVYVVESCYDLPLKEHNL